MKPLNSLIIFLNPRRHLNLANNARQRPPPRELPNLPPEHLHLLRALTVTRRRDPNEVLKKLGTSLLLESQRELDGAVQKLGDDAKVVLHHVAGREGRGAETDTTGGLSGSVTGDGVLC